MIPDAEMQRSYCNVVVRCRRTSENSVDLPKGGQKLFSFSTSVRPLHPLLPMLLPPPPPLPSFFTYTLCLVERLSFIS